GRRRRVRLCRENYIARDTSLQAPLQHEVSWHLCGLRCDHVDLWTNSHRHSSGVAFHKCGYSHPYLFPWPAIDKFNGRTCSGNELCGAFCECVGARLCRPCNTLCAAPRARCNPAPVLLNGSPRVGAAICERVALWRGTVDEAAGSSFCGVWGDLCCLWQSPSRSSSQKNSRARPDFQCRHNSSIGNYLFDSLANRRFREVLVLDNRLRAPICQPGSFECSAPNLRVQR